MPCDLLITGADVVLPGGVKSTPVAVTQGKITGFAEEAATEVVNAAGLWLLPAAIDPHVHYNEPGRSDWEGWATGSRASAAGGAACVFEMPLNARPPTLDAPSFEAKRAAAEAQSVIDFGLWGGLTPGNLDKLGELRDCGVVGLKAFMAKSGTDDFRHADADTLRRGMRKAAALGLLVAVHAESDEMTSRLAAEARRAGRTGMKDYLASRPIEAELEAIREACSIAGETGCRLHVVHVSSGAGIAEILDARRRGVDVSCETCPHYLVMSGDDAERIGAAAKCAPPLRPPDVVRDLRARVLRGEVDVIGSDHSPAPQTMKESSDFFEVWGGIAGCQHLLPLLFDGERTPELIATLTAEHVARRFGVAREKGAIAPGRDADLVLIRPGGEPIRAEALHYRHRISAYVGFTPGATVECCWVRGRRAYSRKPAPIESRGRLLRNFAHD